jgi:hypothetical protein
VEDDASIEGTLSGDGETATMPNRTQDRLDVATLERQGDNIAVVFHEAKHFTNPALRARTGPAAVIGQLRRYRSTLIHHASDSIGRYRAACHALVRLDAMRRHARSVTAPTLHHLDPLVHEVATGKADLSIDPDPRLIVFGFDADQKKGQLQTILTALRKIEPGLAIYAAGDPASAGGAFRPPPKQKPQQKSHT